MDASELCTRKTVIIQEDKSVKEAARLMKQYNVGCVIVIRPQNSHNIPIGMITDRDLLLAIIDGDKSYKEIPVHTVMKVPVITVHESTTLNDALGKMRFHGIRRVPVVDGAGTLTGILSIDDILGNISRELNEIVKLFRKEEPTV